MTKNVDMPLPRQPYPITLDDLRRQRKPPHDAQKEFEESLSRDDRFALTIARRVGSRGSFLVLALCACALAAGSLLAPPEQDAFLFGALLVGFVQLLLLSVVLWGQRLQNRAAAMQNAKDRENGQRTETEREAILSHLEYQNTLLIALLDNAGIAFDEAFQPVLKK